jgi:hypothetical protein
MQRSAPLAYRHSVFSSIEVGVISVSVVVHGKAALTGHVLSGPHLSLTTETLLNHRLSDG